ncbi:anti-anti-sigma regulatory factor [Pontibacter aydingkolensis]
MYSSIGLSGIVNLLLELKSANISIVLYRCDNLVTRLLKLLKLENLFYFSSTLDDAYLLLNKTYKTAC